MVAIGELVFKARFDGRELTKGMMSSRQQMTAAKKIAEESRSPLDKYRTGLENLAAMSQRYTHVAAKQNELSAKLEKQYLEEEQAIRKLTKAERDRLQLLQLPDQIKKRNSPEAKEAARKERFNRDRNAGLARQSMFKGIDKEQTDGRASLARRLADFKRERAERDRIMSGVGVTRGEAMAAYGRFDSTWKPQPKQSQNSNAASSKQSQSSNIATTATAAAGLTSRLGSQLLIGGAIGGLAAKGVLKYAEVEKSAAALEVLSGSIGKTNKMMKEMRELSQKGVSFGALTQSAQTMMSFGVAAENVMPMLKSIANISRGNADQMKSLALAFGQTTASGKLMGQEVLQMVNAGFNPLQQISQLTGKSMLQLRKEMEDGSISAKMVENAFISATSAGGRFNGMLDKIGETSSGALSKMNAQIEMITTNIGQELSPAVQQLANLFGNVDSSASKGTAAVGLFGRGIAAWMALTQDVLNEENYVTTGMGPTLYKIPELDKALDSFDKLDQKKQIEKANAKRLEAIKKEEEKLLKMRREYESRQRELAGNTVDWVKKANWERNITESIAINKQIKLIRDLKREHEQLNNEKKKAEPLKTPAALAQKEGQKDKPTKDEKKKDKKEDPLDTQAKSMLERNKLPMERFREGLQEVNKLQAMNKIDAMTADRERMKLRDQFKNEQAGLMRDQIDQERQQQQPKQLTAIAAKSSESVAYMAQLREQIKQANQPKKQKTKIETKIDEVADQMLNNSKEQTVLLRKMADTSPRKIR